MASVFLARDTVLNRDVAIKMVHPHLLQNVETLRRFSNEAQAIASLSHDNIVKIYDYGRSETQPYIVMEYIDGCTLETLLARELRLPCLVTLEIAFQALSGLICAHEKGIYHRDIKTGNILVDGSGRLRITDFGIAYLVNSESLTLTGSFLGSPRFVSPEQISNRKVSATTDIFSLGVLLYRCLTGVFPFDADTPHGIINAILSTTPAAPAVVNRQLIFWLSDGVEAFLEKDPERRPSAREAFARLDAACRADGLRSGKERLSAFVNNARQVDSGEQQELCSHYSGRARSAWRERRLPTALRLFEQAGRFGVLDSADVKLVGRISRQSVIRRFAIAAVIIAGMIGLSFPLVSMIDRHHAGSGRMIVKQTDARVIDGSAVTEPAKQQTVPFHAIPHMDTGRGNSASLADEQHRTPLPAMQQRPVAMGTPSGDSSTGMANENPATSAAPAGFFICLTNPPWVTMYIDGIERGKTPTLSALPLPAGKHFVRLSRSNFNDFSDSVVVFAAETTRVRVKLDPLQQGSSAP